MQRKKFILSVLSIIILALANLALWLAGLIWQNDWNDLDWLWASQNSIFGINFLLVVAYLLPVGILKGISWKKLWLPGLELYFVAIIAFFISKSLIYSLFFPVFSLTPLLLWVMLAVLALTTAGSFFYLTRNHLYPVRVIFIPLMIATEILVGVLSVITAYLFMDEPRFSEALVRSVKYGLPFFYVTLLLGLFSILSIKKLSLREESGEDREELLDDLMM